MVVEFHALVGLCMCMFILELHYVVLVLVCGKLIFTGWCSNQQIARWAGEVGDLAGSITGLTLITTLALAVPGLIMLCPGTVVSLGFCLFFQIV